MALIEEHLRGLNVAVERSEHIAVRAIPRRSDLELHEDANAAQAFAGSRERWSPDALRPMPLPVAYAHNVEAADVRAQIVDAGAGEAADLERLAGQRVRVEGMVALVAAPMAPEARGSTIFELAERLHAAGCVGLLVAPLEEGSGWVLGRRGPEPTALAIPAIPVRFDEAAEIRTRLRSRRVRGSDGSAITLRAGPGPVEAHIVIECPREVLRAVPTLVIPGAGKLADPAPLLADAAEGYGLFNGGANTLEACVEALRQIAPDQPRRTLILGPLPANATRPIDVVPCVIHAADGLWDGAVAVQARRIPRGDRQPAVGWVDHRSKIAPSLTRGGAAPRGVRPEDFLDWMGAGQRWIAHTLCASSAAD